MTSIAKRVATARNPMPVGLDAVSAWTTMPRGAVHSWDLWAELPAPFQTAVFMIHERPFSAVIYNYDYIGQRQIDCSALPTAMQHELAWWLWSLFECGEGVSPITLTVWKNLVPGINDARRQAAEPQCSSFLDLSFEEWMVGARRSYHERYGTPPGPSFGRNYEHLMRRLHRALATRYSTVEWWRQDVWDPKHDQRVPMRSHESKGGYRVRFDTTPQVWLREAMKWFLAVGLERGEHSWPSLAAYRVQLGSQFATFLASEDIDTPVLCANPAIELRVVALRYLGFLRQLRHRWTGQPLVASTVSAGQATLARFYAFMVDHQHEAAALLHEPRWLDLTDAHARLWRDGEMRRSRPERARPEYIEPGPLSQIVEHLDIVGMPTTQTKIVAIQGEPVTVAGLGDPQAMRAYLLAVLTGRRIGEILMMDFDPLEPIPGLPGGAEGAEHAMVARLRYQQTKIEGAPSTILVERAVVNIVREQQQWLRNGGLRDLAGVSRARPDGGAVAASATPRYLFLMTQRNRLAQRPYSQATLGARIARLVDILQIRDSQGRIVDFQRSHRLRHTKATDLLNAGVPVHVVQRYLGHLSPEMTMHYAQTLAQTHEREFLRLAKITSDGRRLELNPRDVYELVQLDKRTDRILPNGLCLLPPRQVCDRGNACLTCDQFATDASYLAEHEQQLHKLDDLIEQRQTLFQERTGHPMGEDNVWLEVRRREQRALGRIITALKDPALSAPARSVRGAGVAARQPAAFTDRAGT